MNKPATLFLCAMGAVVIVLAALDYAVSRREARKSRDTTVQLVNNYRYGSGDVPFAEERAVIDGQLEQAVGHAWLRARVAGLLGVVLIVVGLSLLFGAKKDRPKPPSN